MDNLIVICLTSLLIYIELDYLVFNT